MSSSASYYKSSSSASPRRYCLPTKYALPYSPSPGFGARWFPVVCLQFGVVSRLGIVSSFHTRCWFNKHDGEFVGFTQGELANCKCSTVLGKAAYEKELTLKIVGVGEVPVVAVMSEALPEGSLPILGEKVREAMNFSIVENLGEYPAEEGFEPYKRLFFRGFLRRKAAEECPYYDV